MIEMLVVVLIIGVLSAIAFPIYTRAVEKSRAANPMANLSAIAKAQNARMLATYHYTNDMNNLDISLIDESSGERATGGSFDTEYFTYRVYGDDRGVATATRKNATGEKQYELSVNYGMGQIFCRPMTNKTCIDLNLEEGQDYSQSSWQETVCSDTQISCYVRETDGNFEYKLCEQNYHSPYCAYDVYNADWQQLTHYYCSGDNLQNGFCSQYNAMKEEDPDMDMERRCLEIEGLECKTWGNWRQRK